MTLSFTLLLLLSLLLVTPAFPVPYKEAKRLEELQEEINALTGGEPKSAKHVNRMMKGHFKSWSDGVLNNLDSIFSPI